MKFLINRIFIITAAVIFFSLPVMAFDDDYEDNVKGSSKEYPVYRVTAVNPYNYKDQYSEALNNDPYESINRAIFGFNDTVDVIFLEPIAKAYKNIFPKWGRDRVSDFFGNLGEINNFLNSIFQGDIESTFRSATRFGINSTFGVAGLHDVAAGFGLKEKQKSFSQTLALYGFDSGNYLVLPFLGPSTSRDLVGEAFGRASDPVNYISNGYLAAAFGLVELVDVRSDIINLTDEIKMTSFDPYSTFKSSYLQYQKRQLLKTIE